MGLRKTLRKLLGYKDPEPFLNEAFSQEGEDLVLHRIFEYSGLGYFVDVGAHHPLRFSNTYKFYKLGWRGINIDAMPGSMALFNKLRPLDINLEIPVADKAQILPFYIFNEPALNTLSKEVAEERDGKNGYAIQQVIDIETQSLAQIFKKHLPNNQTINFLSIDAEGFDFQILKSNDWTAYRPQIVLIESDLNYAGLITSELNTFMNNQGYDFYAKTVRTFFYKDNSFSIQSK